jgi:hypothetical protein
VTETMSGDVIEELRKHLRDVAHLPPEEQIRTFDGHLGFFEQHIVGEEKNKTEYDAAIQRCQSAPAKAQIMAVLLPNEAKVASMAEYLSVLNDAFPSSDRVYSLKTRFNSMLDFFASKKRALER